MIALHGQWNNLQLKYSEYLCLFLMYSMYAKSL